jgi:hypothetical protein
MWGNHYSHGEGMMFTIANFRIGQGRIYRTPPYPAARDSKSTARKIEKELPHFRVAE